VALLAHRGDVASDAGEDVGALAGAERARDFLADFDHPDVALREVVVERRIEVVHEREDRRPVLVEPPDEVAALGAGRASPFSRARGIRVLLVACNDEIGVPRFENGRRDRAERAPALRAGRVDGPLDLDQQGLHRLGPSLPVLFPDR